MMANESLDLIGETLQHLNESKVPGDVVEAGCNNGMTSIFIASVLEGSGRTLHCYDLFSPIPESCVHMPSETGDSYVPLADVQTFQKLFSDNPDVPCPKTYAGAFSETMPTQLPETIAFALIDADYYQSVKDALIAILPRLSQGGIVAVHDWEQHKWGAGVQQAVREVWSGNVDYNRGLAVICK